MYIVYIGYYISQSNHRIIPPPMPSTGDKALSMFHSSDYIQFLKSKENDLYEDDELDEEYGMGQYITLRFSWAMYL